MEVNKNTELFLKWGSYLSFLYSSASSYWSLLNEQCPDEGKLEETLFMVESSGYSWGWRWEGTHNVSVELFLWKKLLPIEKHAVVQRKSKEPSCITFHHSFFLQESTVASKSGESAFTLAICRGECGQWQVSQHLKSTLESWDKCRCRVSLENQSNL